MKALLVFREDDTDNLFVPVLCNALIRQDIDIHCSVRDFWDENNERFDIIHFQWPEEVIGWNCSDPTAIERLKQRIAYFRESGCKFVYTRHNTLPHYNANPVIRQAYEVIEANADLVVHMGLYSYEEFSGKHSHCQHTIIPHHIYENTYNECIPPEEARCRLGIPRDSFVVTAFGKFRNKEEIHMVIKAFSQYHSARKILLAPRLLPFSKHPSQANPFKRVVSFLGYHLAPRLLRLKHIKAGANEELVTNDDLPYYLSASDVIFVQRKRILNSGNIPLAFLFRKVVIGPDCGNVGEVLQETGNPVFDPGDAASIARAMEQAEALSKQNKGEDNYQYARCEMGLDKVAGMYAEAYKELLTTIR